MSQLETYELHPRNIPDKAKERQVYKKLWKYAPDVMQVENDLKKELNPENEV